MQHDVAAAKRELLSTWDNYSHIRASGFGARATSPSVAVGGVGGCPAGGIGKDTRFFVPYRVVWPKGAIRGLHGSNGYTSARHGPMTKVGITML